MSDILDHDDPFSPEADPYAPARRIPLRAAVSEPHDCHCGNSLEVQRGPSLSRRQALFGVGALASLPVLASAAPFPVPCVQEKQKVTPCHHKYCRYYAGKDDYYGR